MDIKIINFSNVSLQVLSANRKRYKYYVYILIEVKRMSNTVCSILTLVIRSSELKFTPRSMPRSHSLNLHCQYFEICFAYTVSGVELFRVQLGLVFDFIVDGKSIKLIYFLWLVIYYLVMG